MVDLDRIVLLITGVSLDRKSDSKRHRIRNRIDFGFVLLFVILTNYSVVTSMTNYNYNEMVLYLVPFLCANYMVLATSIYMFRRDQFYKFNDRLEMLKLELSEMEEKALKKDIALFLKIYFSCMCICMVTIVLTPGLLILIELINADDIKWRLPFLLKTPFEIDNFTVFLCVYLVLGYGITVGVFVNYNDAVCFGYCLTLKGHFEVIQRRFTDQDFRSYSYRQELRDLINHHNTLFSAVKVFQEAFKPIVFLVFVVGGIMMCTIFHALFEVLIYRMFCSNY